MSVLFDRYLKALQEDYTSITKLEFLYPDGAIAFDITTDLIQDGGSINVQLPSATANSIAGMRRTATVTVDNWANLYDINANKIWPGSMVRLLKGLILSDGTEYYLPQGKYYINNPSQIFNPNSRATTFNLVDKWAYLDGSLFGKIAGVYQINVGNNLFTAISQLLKLDRGNGYKLDSDPPILSSYYKDKTYLVGETSYYYLNCPYTAKISGTYADVISEAAAMLVASAGYDKNAQLRIEPANTDTSGTVRPILWDFTTSEKLLTGIDYSYDFTAMYNHVVITGGTLNGHIAKGEATDTDPRSPMNVGLIGKKTYVDEQSKYYADAQCQELADYKLNEFKKLNQTVTIHTAPMYHLMENCIVTLFRNDLDTNKRPFIINSMSIPIGQTGEMTISASRIDVPIDVPYDYRVIQGTETSYPLGLFRCGTI